MAISKKAARAISAVLVGELGVAGAKVVSNRIQGILKDNGGKGKSLRRIHKAMHKAHPVKRSGLRAMKAA